MRSLRYKSCLWGTIRRIQDKLDISDYEMSQMLDLSVGAYRKKRARQEELLLTEVDNLSRELGVTLSALVYGTLDLNTLKKHYNCTDSLFVPEKYRFAAFSRIFTLRNVAQQAAFYGMDRDLFRHLQINPELVLSGENCNISALAIRDACLFMKNLFHKGDFYAIGARNAFQLRQGNFGRVLSDTRSFKELFEALLSVVHFIEENWDYRVEHLSNRKVILQAFVSEKMKEAHKDQPFSSDDVTNIRLGFMKELPKYIGLHTAKVRQLKSSWAGDTFCEFEILNQGGSLNS